MRKLTLLLLTLITLSCNTKEQCDCIKEYYEFQSIILLNGNEVNTFPELISQEQIGCQQENYVNTSNTSYYVIVCE